VEAPLRHGYRRIVRRIIHIKVVCL